MVLLEGNDQADSYGGKGYIINPRRACAARVGL